MEQEQQRSFVVFFVVAPEDAPVLTQWEGYLLPLQENGYLTIWSEQHLTDEAFCQKESLEHLFQADLILLLMSPSFFATDECLTQAEPQTLHRKIKPVEAFSWSWRRTISGLPGGLLIGLTSGLSGAFIYGLFVGLSAGPAIWLFYMVIISLPDGLPIGLLVGILGGLLGSVIYGFSKELPIEHALSCANEETSSYPTAYLKYP
ncbi:MAG TPA: hypothetical protein VH164_04890 [Ktedonobacteraceae bacterium]|nr:hypothetical protein [Ktedonobacteraceae bacterium]